MIPCTCNDHAEVVSVWPGDEDAFVAGFELRGQRDSNSWIRLYVCPACQTVWYVDLGRSSIGVKLPNEQSWVNFDDGPIRMQLMIDECGGIGREKCKWSGCDNRAVKDRAFCPSHLWERKW